MKSSTSVTVGPQTRRFKRLGVVRDQPLAISSHQRKKAENSTSRRELCRTLSHLNGEAALSPWSSETVGAQSPSAPLPSVWTRVESPELPCRQIRRSPCALVEHFRIQAAELAPGRFASLPENLQYPVQSAPVVKLETSPSQGHGFAFGASSELSSSGSSPAGSERLALSPIFQSLALGFQMSSIDPYQALVARTLLKAAKRCDPASTLQAEEFAIDDREVLLLAKNLPLGLSKLLYARWRERAASDRSIPPDGQDRELILKAHQTLQALQLVSRLISTTNCGVGGDFGFKARVTPGEFGHSDPLGKGAEGLDPAKKGLLGSTGSALGEGANADGSGFVKACLQVQDESWTLAGPKWRESQPRQAQCVSKARASGGLAKLKSVLPLTKKQAFGAICSASIGFGTVKVCGLLAAISALAPISAPVSLGVAAAATIVTVAGAGFALGAVSRPRIDRVTSHILNKLDNDAGASGASGVSSG